MEYRIAYHKSVAVTKDRNRNYFSLGLTKITKYSVGLKIVFEF